MESYSAGIRYIVLCYIVITASVVSGASISGRVLNQMTNESIGGALIILMDPSDESFSKTTLSDERGYFRIADIREGVYQIEAVKDGFFKNILFDFEVKADRVYEVKVKLLKQEGKSSDEYCFMLGGIEVCAQQRDIIPEEPVTIRKIDSGEIEHMQATNLGDVLSLVPGIEKTENPGLSKPSHVGIRSLTESAPDVYFVNESFGTAIIVDGNALTSDANASGKVYGSTGTQGLDLRTIPADNIESVEVITGVPSVEYGNFSNGIIKVTTKSGWRAPKLKAKINPDTKSMSFSHGMPAGRTVLDYHLNYGYSERDLRKEGDEYHRIHGNSTVSIPFMNRLNTKLRTSYTKMIDNEEPTDVWKLKNYNRGYRASGNLSLDYKVSENDRIEGFLGVDLNRKRYFKEKWVNDPVIVSRDTTIIDTVNSGIVQIDTVLMDTLAGYIGKLKEIGKEWQYTAKLQRKLTREIGKKSHDLLLGAEWQYEKTQAGD